MGLLGPFLCDIVSVPLTLGDYSLVTRPRQSSLPSSIRLKRDGREGRERTGRVADWGRPSVDYSPGPSSRTVLCLCPVPAWRSYPCLPFLGRVDDGEERRGRSPKLVEVSVLRYQKSPKILCDSPVGDRRTSQGLELDQPSVSSRRFLR